MIGFIHVDDADCPCGPSVVYVHQEATDADTTDTPLGQCADEEEYEPGSWALCTLYQGHRGEHYRPSIQGLEAGE